MILVDSKPWHEKTHAQRQRKVAVVLLGYLTVTSLFLACWYAYNEYLIDHQIKRNTYLRTELDQINQDLQEIKRLEKMQQAITVRMQVVKNLQASRPQTVRLLDELVNILPEGVQLTRLSQADDIINLAGLAASNGQISSLMRNTTASTWLTNPQLLLIEQKQHSNTTSVNEIQHFNLTMQQTVSAEVTTR